MKFQIVSDLHREFVKDRSVKTRFEPENVVPGIDALIFAGDMHTHPSEFARELAIFPKELTKIAIFGNHEFYGNDYLKVKEKYKQEASNVPNVIILDNDHVDLGDVRILGSTLWTSLDQGRCYRDVSTGMNDYWVIMHQGRRLKPGDTIKFNQDAVTWLKKKLEESTDKKVVVVTHHAPSLESITDEFINNPLNGAYADDLEYLMCEYSPKLWIHGHMHSAMDYFVGLTRVICNPHGYMTFRGMQETGFKPDLVIEV